MIIELISLWTYSLNSAFHTIFVRNHDFSLWIRCLVLHLHIFLVSDAALTHKFAEFLNVNLL